MVALRLNKCCFVHNSKKECKKDYMIHEYTVYIYFLYSRKTTQTDDRLHENSMRSGSHEQPCHSSKIRSLQLTT